MEVFCSFPFVVAINESHTQVSSFGPIIPCSQPCLRDQAGSLRYADRNEGILLRHLQEGDTALALGQGADGALRLSTVHVVGHAAPQRRTKAPTTHGPPGYHQEGCESPFFGWIPEEMSEFGCKPATAGSVLETTPQR